MSSEDVIQQIVNISDNSVDNSTKKWSMSSNAKEFVPKNKFSDDDIVNGDETELKFDPALKNLTSDTKLEKDYSYSDSNYSGQINCMNISECIENHNDPCVADETYINNSSSQPGPARPTSLHVGSITDASVYHPLTMQNQTIYTMESAATSYGFFGAQGSLAYTHIGGQDPNNYAVPPVIQASSSPVVIQQVNQSSIDMFQSYHNSGGSSPHSYQSVSPPIITGTNNGTSTTIGGEHYVMVHVNLGETFSIRVGDQIQNISGPATVRMVSNSGPPTPMPMQVPPGHMVQQIVDEHGILTHVILSPLHQPTQCLGPHVQHLHQSNPQSSFYSPGQNNNGSMPLYSNNYNLYNNGMNISQAQNVNSSQGIIATTKSSTDNGLIDQSSKSRAELLGNEKPSHCDFNGSSQNNSSRSLNNYADSKPRQSKNRGHQYHHPSQTEEGSHYVKPRASYMVSSLVSDAVSSNESNHHQDKAMNNSGYPNHSHYSKIRKKRPFSNSASANTKHHYVHDQTSSPASSADEATTILTDEEKNSIMDVLNKMEQPEVSEIEARSALIHIIAPIVPDNPVATINPVDFSFQLHFAERSPDSRFNCVFFGEAMEISLQDLKPATVYYVKVCCTYEGIVGAMSPANKFTTASAEPNQPKPVQLQTKSRNSVQLKWSSPIENGSKITDFVVEYCKADSSTENYISGFRGNTKTCKILKLKPSTEYLFRLAAINSHGQSQWSEPTSITTSGTAPLPPDPPTVARADIGGLLLTWNKRTTDDTFCLEMMDEATGYGFITVFNGPEVEHYVENLRRNTSYRFHLAASNQDGRSKWSDVVTIATKPDLPSQPLKLHVRGKITATQFVLVWDPPEDDGGLAVTCYKLELDITASDTSDGSDSDRDWVLFYEGIDREYQCKGLVPGSAVLARVSAKSSMGGWGNPCAPITIHLAAMPPGQMSPPRKDIGNKSKGGIFTPGGINLLWERPENDGGSVITNYELCQWSLKSKSKVSPTSSCNQNIVLEEYVEECEEQIVYSGSQVHCQISGLIPGAQYRYRVRAMNKAGNSKWSNPLDATSGPSAPEGPSEAPTVLCKSSHAAVVSWLAPVLSNGSQVIEYHLEMSSKSEPNADYQLLYNGPNLSHEVKNLQPDSCYRFRVQAINRAGMSPYSPVCEVTTPASVPGQVTSVRTNTITMNSIQLLWKEPAANGSTIISYSIEVTNCNPPTVPTSVATSHSHLLQGVFILSTETADKIIGDLLPDTNYKFRVQAINGVGCGQFSSIVKASTLSPPPAPPRLECLNVQSNAIKLRWHNDYSARQYYINRLLGNQHTPASKPTSISLTHGSSEPSISQYQLQMSRQPDAGWSNVYTGSLQFHKLGKLLESTSYYLRIMASNEIGDGDFSEPFMVVTEKAAPPPVRAPKAVEVTNDSCLIEWPAVRSMNYDPIVYILQLLTISEKDCDYKQVYRGSDTTYRLTNLSLDTEYMTRVCAVRLCSPSTIEPDNSSDSSSHSQRGSTDHVRSERSSSRVTELLGAFSKSTSFTTCNPQNNRRTGTNPSSTSGNPSYSGTSTEGRKLAGGVASTTVHVPLFVSRLTANLGPFTDNHVIALLLILFTLIVLGIAHYIQPYLK